MKKFILISIFSFLTGCATMNTSVNICHPPLAPEGWQTWPVVSVESQDIKIKDGRILELSIIRYQSGIVKMAAVWSEQKLIMFDYDTSDRNSPLWFNSGLISQSGELFTNPGPCRWRSGNEINS